MSTRPVTCPGCDRGTWVTDGQYDAHHPTLGSPYCFMSGMPEPVVGRDEEAMKQRAQIVARLAVEVHDGDPHAVWNYLRVVPAEFVAELLQVALAGMDVEGKRVSEIWAGWLP